MPRITSIGTCNLCGQEFDKAGMTRHLKKCRAEHPPAGKGRRRKTFHLMVEGRYRPAYWMHIEIPAGATLETLDAFLRDTWLECCGHLSAFTIENARYEMDTGGIDGMWVGLFGPQMPSRSMKVRLDKALRPGLKFIHEYDFGTTTTLALKVVGEQEGVASPGDVLTLARNHPPVFKCEVCGELATLVCTECVYDDEGWVCDEHAEEHRCGEDMMLPVVNSPRMGECGYTG